MKCSTEFDDLPRIPDFSESCQILIESEEELRNKIQKSLDIEQTRRNNFNPAFARKNIKYRRNK